MINNFQQYTITKIFIADKNKEGKPYVDSRGKKFWRISLNVDEGPYKDKWISGMTYDQNDEVFQWKPGDQQLLDIYPKGEFLNFKRR